METKKVKSLTFTHGSVYVIDDRNATGVPLSDREAKDLARWLMHPEHTPYVHDGEVQCSSCTMRGTVTWT
jgi:hypothetical protein